MISVDTNSADLLIISEGLHSFEHLLNEILSEANDTRHLDRCLELWRQIYAEISNQCNPPELDCPRDAWAIEQRGQEVMNLVQMMLPRLWLRLSETQRRFPDGSTHCVGRR